MLWPKRLYLVQSSPLGTHMDVQAIITELCTTSASGNCIVSAGTIWTGICAAVTSHAFVATAAFLVSRWYYLGSLALKDGVIGQKDAEIANLKTQLESYKAKFNGATPEEAKARMDMLEATLKRVVDSIAPRRLSDDQSNAISRTVSGSHFVIDIAADSAPDADSFSDFLYRAFEKGGWTASNPSVAGIFDVPSGLAVVLKNLAAMTPAERKVIEALNAAGLKFDTRAIDLSEFCSDESDAVILVTSRPM